MRGAGAKTQQGGCSRMKIASRKESHAFFTRVRNAFLEIARREPQRVVMVDARPEIEVVHAEIVRVVEERMLG